MAKTVSEEEIQLRKRARRRLVGAIAMVIAAVVILPMVLDSQPEQRDQDIDIFIPSEDEVGELAPEAENPEEPSVPAAPAPQGKPAAEIRPAPANPAPPPPPPKKPLTETPVTAAPRPQEKSPAEKPRQLVPGSAAALGGMDTRLREPPGEQSGGSSQTASDSVPDAKSKTPSISSPGSEAKFVVQSGAFSNPEKAEQQLRRLESYDISAYSETFRSGRYEITRVRIGPYSTREEAEKMSKQLKKLGFGAVVTEK